MAVVLRACTTVWDTRLCRDPYRVMVMSRMNTSTMRPDWCAEASAVVIRSNIDDLHEDEDMNYFGGFATLERFPTTVQT